MIFERFLAPKKEPILWTSASYFSLVDQLDTKQIDQSLTWDLISFLHEYVGLKDKKIYPYGPHGIMDAYHQKTSDLCAKQESSLEENDLDPTRARFETKSALTIETWMADDKTTTGQKLIVISPRGKIEEGYPGLEKKHYVFINVYEKIDENDFQLVQYLSYASEKELFSLQSKLLNQERACLYLPKLGESDHQKLKPKNLSHQIIDRPLLVTNQNPPLTYQEIEALIYQNEHKWVTTRKQLPHVEEDLFSQELTKIIELLLGQFWILSQEMPSVAILHFDELIIVVREYFLKWMEDHATNYHNNQTLAPYALNLDLILENWQLRLKKKSGQADKDEEEKLETLKKTIALDPLQPLLRASSVAHCIVGTPGSVAMQIIKLNPNVFSVGSGELEKISVDDKKALLRKIKKEQMVEIQLSPQEIWMVPVSFLEGKGCYLNENKVAMGPCDVPLSDSFAFPMSQVEFELFVDELEKQVYGTELDQIANMTAISAMLSQPEQEQFKEKIEKIKKLIFKPVVSIGELISGDIVKSFHHHKDLDKIIFKLRTSANPLTTSDSIISKLLEDQNGVLGFEEV